MVFLLFMTTWAMVLNLLRFRREDQVLLLAVGGGIFVLELWLLFEAVAAVQNVIRSRTHPD
jgi:carbon starvation protein